MSDAPSLSISFTIPSDKITHYLLNVSHPRGGTKVRFFLAFGFSPDRPMELAEALANHVLAAPHRRLSPAEGRAEKLVFEGEIGAPDGRRPWVRSIWQVEADASARLISAVPLRQKS